jgi:predicted HTH transcriptional regulator
LQDWPQTQFIDDRDGCLFTSLVERPVISSPRKKEILKEHAPINAPINAPLSELQEQILKVMEESPWIAYEDIAVKLEKDRSTIKRNIQQLKTLGVLRRLGSKKKGSWKIIK